MYTYGILRLLAEKQRQQQHKQQQQQQCQRYRRRSNLLDRIRRTASAGPINRPLTGSRGVFFSREREARILYSAGYTLRRNLNHKPPPTRLLFFAGDIVNSYSADVASKAEIMEVGAIKKKKEKNVGALSLTKLYLN